MVKADKVVSATTIQCDMGRAIRITGGAYSGKRGWLRKSKTNRGKTFTYVLLDLGNGSVMKTYVQSDHVDTVADANAKPKSYAHAILEQHDDIEALMNSLSAKLAQFNLDKGEVREDLCVIFAEKLHRAVKRQALRGSKARYRLVYYEDKKDTEEMLFEE